MDNPLTASYMCHVAFDIYVDDSKKTGHLFNLDLIEREDARLCH